MFIEWIMQIMADVLHFHHLILQVVFVYFSQCQRMNSENLLTTIAFSVKYFRSAKQYIFI